MFENMPESKLHKNNIILKLTIASMILNVSSGFSFDLDFCD
jgi:hypothetical protein